jgi:hypothetical protein
MIELEMRYIPDFTYDLIEKKKIEQQLSTKQWERDHF